MEPGLIFVGTHRRAHRTDRADVAFGIYSFRSERGRLHALGMTATPQPGWITMHPGGRFLYVANEVGTFEGTVGGGVSAFAVDLTSGSLRALNCRPTSALPCHCEVDASGRYLLVATHGGGAVHLFPLCADGRIGAEADRHEHAGSGLDPRRQADPHAHAVAVDPANRFVLVPDLGIDQVVVYELALSRGKLVPRPECNARLPPGSGPRHVVFGPQGRFLYLMNELSASITAFAYDQRQGELREIQTAQLLPNDFSGLRSGAELGIDPTGRFLYATTRSHGSSGEPPVRGLDSLVWFKIDAQSGVLSLRGSAPSGGEIPRSFTFDGNGGSMLVAHQCSGSLVPFLIDPETGAPRPVGEITATPVPVCLRFVGI
jgi:6-phosphogluconolactonase